MSQRAYRTFEKSSGASLSPDKASLLIFKPLKMVLCSFCDDVPLKFKKEIWPGLQFTRTDYLSLVLTPLRIRWSIPLSAVETFWEMTEYCSFGDPLSLHFLRERSIKRVHWLGDNEKSAVKLPASRNQGVRLGPKALHIKSFCVKCLRSTEIFLNLIK